jgi:hypothetical protein
MLASIVDTDTLKSKKGAGAVYRERPNSGARTMADVANAALLANLIEDLGKKIAKLENVSSLRLAAFLLDVARLELVNNLRDVRKMN